MVRKEELTDLAIRIAELKARAEILELMNVKDLLEIAYSDLMIDIWEFMQAERNSLLEHVEADERGE